MKLWQYLLFGAGILILGSSPIIMTALAGTIANIYGCTLHEGNINPCMINGQDYGKTLYSLGMLGWLAIATLPITALLIIIWLVFGIFLLVKRHFRAKN